MTMMQLGFLAFAFASVSALVWAVFQFAGGNATANRLKHLFGTTPPQSQAELLVDKVARLTKPLAKLSKPDEGFEGSALRRRFFNAGLRGASAPTAYFGAKAALAVIFPLLAFTVLTVLLKSPAKGNILIISLLATAALGYYLPNIVLSRLVFVRQREIFENFPDALDLMTVAVEAGLGTEAALTRVAEDIVHKSPVLSEELRLVNLELRAGAQRERALRNLSIRTGVEEVDGFVSMIIQAERFGTSTAAALRVHSDMLRTRRRQKAEELAAKISLKLLFPLIFFIFPSLILVLMGPAMIQIYRVMLPALGGK